MRGNSSVFCVRRALRVSRSISICCNAMIISIFLALFCIGPNKSKKYYLELRACCSRIFSLSSVDFPNHLGLVSCFPTHLAIMNLHFCRQNLLTIGFEQVKVGSSSSLIFVLLLILLLLPLLLTCFFPFPLLHSIITLTRAPILLAILLFAPMTPSFTPTARVRT